MKRLKQQETEEALRIPRRHQTFVEMQNICPLCNAQLTIRVESYLEENTLREEASCPKCLVLARVKDHKMH